MSFNLKSILLAVVLFAVSYYLPFFRELALGWVWISTVLLYLALNILLRKWVDGVKNAPPIKFTTAIMGATTVKMLTTLTIVTVYLALKQPEAWSFALGVFSVFMANTVLFAVDAQRLVRKG